MCIIQAKRYRNAVGVEPVRAGRRHGRQARHQGHTRHHVLVTKDGHAFATRHGRIEIRECEHVKYLRKEHLSLDVLISLPKPPPH